MKESGVPYLRLVSDRRNEHSALASRYHLAEVSHTELQATLAMWREVAPDGVLVRGRHPLHRILEDRRLNRDRVCVIPVAYGEPLDWPIIFHGRFRTWERQAYRPPATRVRDLPWPALAAATARTYTEALAERRPVVHRLSLTEPGRIVVYDRLVLPTSKRAGDPVDMILTASVDLIRTDL